MTVPRRLEIPPADPTRLFELFRGAHATELLTAAVLPFNIFGRLAGGARPRAELQRELGLADRAATVLFTALKAMQLLREDGDSQLSLSDLARTHLVPTSPFHVGDYLGLAAESPGVRAMVERLQTNRPAGQQPEQEGVAFIYREGLDSAMEREASARRLTVALAGRARNVAPVLAQRISLAEADLLLDLGGGTGLYSIAWLQRHPRLRAVVLDRPEVLKVAQEEAVLHGVAERLECQPGDMFRSPLPSGVSAILLSNVLHDWDVPECRALVRRCADALPSGGRLLIHDVLLNDALDGPLPIALYSAALFSLTEGRAYSAAEYRAWSHEAGLICEEPLPTLIHCSVLPARKP